MYLLLFVAIIFALKSLYSLHHIEMPLFLNLQIRKKTEIKINDLSSNHKPAVRLLLQVDTRIQAVRLKLQAFNQ